MAMRASNRVHGSDADADLGMVGKLEFEWWEVIMLDYYCEKYEVTRLII